MDECGLLAWVELPLWLPQINDRLKERIRTEYPRIIRQLKGYTCLSVVSLGCELDASVEDGILKDMYELTKQELNVLVRDNSGSGECYNGLAVDYADFSDYHFYAELTDLEQLIEEFTPRWRGNRPWLFGEFCDSDTMRDLQRLRLERGVEKLDWEISDPRRNPVSALKTDFYAHRHDENMLRSGIRKDFDEIYALSLAHSFAYRKTILEMTRSFEAVNGYNVTNLRDVPIATSGLLDDQGRNKFPPEVFSTFNADLMLLPAWDLSRIWIGADRTFHPERYNYIGGDTYALHVLCSNYKADLCGAELHYRLRRGNETLLTGSIGVPRLRNGGVEQAGYIRVQLPQSNYPVTLRLDVSLDLGKRLCANTFPIFLYPRENRASGRLAVYDGTGALSGIERRFDVRFIQLDEPVPTGCSALVTTAFNCTARQWMEGGGLVILVQIGEGSLPVVHVPMWREGMMRACDREILRQIPQADWLDDLRYFSMTTDVAFDSEKIENAQPILRRYDCRKWQASDYVLRIRYGKGECIATTLRLAGGRGKATGGIHNNPFSTYLLRRMLAGLGVTPVSE